MRPLQIVERRIGKIDRPPLWRKDGIRDNRPGRCIARRIPIENFGEFRGVLVALCQVRQLPFPTHGPQKGRVFVLVVYDGIRLNIGRYHDHWHPHAEALKIKVLLVP